MRRVLLSCRSTLPLMCGNGAPGCWSQMEMLAFYDMDEARGRLEVNGSVVSRYRCKVWNPVISPCT